MAALAEKRHCAATRSRVAAPSASVKISTVSFVSANSRVNAWARDNAPRSSSLRDLLSSSNSRAWSRSISVSVAVLAAVSARAFCASSARRHRPSDIDARAAAAAAFSCRIASASSRSSAETEASLDFLFSLFVSSPKKENDSRVSANGSGSVAALRFPREKSEGPAETNAGESGWSVSFAGGREHTRSFGSGNAGGFSSAAEAARAAARRESKPPSFVAFDPRASSTAPPLGSTFSESPRSSSLRRRSSVLRFVAGLFFRGGNGFASASEDSAERFRGATKES